MIIYSGIKREFIDNLKDIPNLLKTRISEKLGEETEEEELLSWMNSLRFMKDVVDTPSIPDDAGIALEYNIPITNNRIDFIITGIDETDTSQVVIIELKQWSYATKTDMDGIVRTHYSDGEKETAHPSYQAYTYCMLLQDYKQAVQDHEVRLKACAYLHNCNDGTDLRNEFYNRYTNYVPVFCKEDKDTLRAFIEKYIRKGDRNKGLFVIEDSEIRPSKNLMDSVSSMMKGNPEFRMIDTQKVAFEKILNALRKYESTGKKQVVIVEGGPGTGKSVIAVNLLQKVITERKLAAYITKNRAPRNVFYRKLVDGGMGAMNVNALFKSSASFATMKENQFDMLIVDEAHRLNTTGSRFSKSQNQVEEIIKASKVSVFFIDENQRVDIKDIGSKAEILKQANDFNCEVDMDVKLTSQFRCGGSDDYLRWIDQLLEISNTKQVYLSQAAYPVKVCDTPGEVMREIKQKNRKNNKSRCVAGYCWDWPEKERNNPNYCSINIPEHRFKAQWNLDNDQTWSISEGSASQIGCIHTCQGLEFDYVGVIIGPDILYRDGHIMVDPSKRASDDFSLRGYKEMMKRDPEGTKELVRQIIKNTYRTLMSRGMKGCYLYVIDESLREYIKSRIR